MNGKTHHWLDEFDADPRIQLFHNPEDNCHEIFEWSLDRQHNPWRRIAVIEDLPKFLVFCRKNFAIALWKSITLVIASVALGVFFALYYFSIFQ